MIITFVFKVILYSKIFPALFLAVASLFFLIPATSAIIAYIFLNETLTFYDILGFGIASIGVFIATRENK